MPRAFAADRRQRIPGARRFKQAHPDCCVAHAEPGALPAELAARRFDLALVVDCLEHLPKRDGLNLLGGIRNLNASRIAVLADCRQRLAETDFSRWRCRPANASSVTSRC
jgi:hypothetical protein